MKKLLTTLFAGTALIGGGAFGGYTTYKEYNKTLEEKLHHVSENGEHLLVFRENEERSLPLVVKMDEKTYNSFTYLIHMIGNDNGKPFSEADVYKLMLKINPEDLGCLSNEEIKAAWEQYRKKGKEMYYDKP